MTSDPSEVPLSEGVSFRTIWDRASVDKLNRLEPNVSQALVKSTAMDLATIIHQLGGARTEQMRRISSAHS